MKKNKFGETQILDALKKQESGMKVSDICRGLKISEPTFYNWKSKYSGMTASDIKRLKELEEENFLLSHFPIQARSASDQRLQTTNTKTIFTSCQNSLPLTNHPNNQKLRHSLLDFFMIK